MQFTNQKVITIAVVLLLIIVIFFSNSLFTQQGMEPFTNEYVNLCRDGPTQLYDAAGSPSIPFKLEQINVSDTDNMSAEANCRKSCSNSNECDMYSMNENGSVCSKFSLNSDSKVFVDCNNKKILDTQYQFKDELQNTIRLNYLGEGLVKTSYYKDNKDNFKTIPYLFDSFVEIKNENEKIQEDLIKLANQDYGSETPEQIRNRVSGEYKCFANHGRSTVPLIGTEGCTPKSNLDSSLIQKVCEGDAVCKRDHGNSLYGNIVKKFNKQKLGDYLGLKDNKLFSYLADGNNLSDYAPPDWDKNIKINNEDIDYTKFVINYDKEKDKELIVKSKTDDNKLHSGSQVGFMLIMVIVLVISIFLLYAFITNNYGISNTVIITYFVVVTIFLYIVHRTFKVKDLFSLKNTLNF